jgi:hypothetical protein
MGHAAKLTGEMFSQYKTGAKKKTVTKASATPTQAALFLVRILHPFGASNLLHSWPLLKH